MYKHIALALSLASLTLASCSTLGTGQKAIIKAPHTANCKTVDPTGFLALAYPQIMAAAGQARGDRVLIVDSKGVSHSQHSGREAAFSGFEQYMNGKYGPNRAAYEPLEITIKIHDRTRVPLFSPVDFRKELATALLAESKLTKEERMTRFLSWLNQPDIYDSTTWDKTLSPLNPPGAYRNYRYFPRISVDFSSHLRSAFPTDRISYLMLIINLKEGQGARFLDFRPKDADLAEFSRGQFTQTLQAQAQAQAGSSQSLSSAITEGSTVTTTTGGSTLGLTAGVSFSDSFVSALADAIERRSTGLLDGGVAFFAVFRSIREVRIGGTYNFDLMLELNSKLDPVQGNSPLRVLSPQVDALKADIYMVGIVRHVYDRGRIGFFNRVPESENDDVYEQVVAKVLPDETIWEFKGEPWLGKIDVAAPHCTLKVVTNHDKAVFVARDTTQNIVASGVGRDATMQLPAVGAGCLIDLEFLPIIDGDQKDGVTTLAATKLIGIAISKGSTKTVSGEYRPKK